MPDLLLELFSEEIPARMQAKAAEDLRALVTDGLVSAGLTYEGAKAFATPRRLALTVHGLTSRSPDLKEERKGPKLDAPEAAIQGFLKSAGLSSRSSARVVSDPKKGDFLVADVVKPGRPAEAIIAELIPSVIRGFPWPKSMRWGPLSAPPGAPGASAEARGTESLRWVRPLHSIVCTFGPETEEPEVVAFDVDGIASGNTTRGHRFMAPAAFKVKRFDDYVAGLEKARVVLDPARRRDIILTDARNLAFAAGLELVEDEGLLHEVAGLVEWPVVLMGTFDPAFLTVPDAVIRATIRANQKCFVVRDLATGNLANRFVLVANIEASDGGATIVAGNERVIRARLSDARFFYEGDLKVPLEARLPKLDRITFHEKLGSQGERVQRIAALARTLAPIVGADPDAAERAALLAKADLVSGMVGEFPELQGHMGRLYAVAQGEGAAVAEAIEDHYRPQGPSDRVPTAPVSMAVALSDKLDMLAGFWAIDEKPTGSKDPFALRRAALGVIRIVLENGVRVGLLRQFSDQLGAFPAAARGFRSVGDVEYDQRAFDLLAFLADRLKVQLRESGARHDLVDAVFALGGQDDLVAIVRRVEALGALLSTDDGRNLLAGYRRAANILKAEERKGTRVGESVGGGLLTLPEEKALASAVSAATVAAEATLAHEDYEGAMRALATLRAPVDAFFEAVLVNDPDEAIRANRLALLASVRDACHKVADFARIEG